MDVRILEKAPEHCPGTGDTSAGKAVACQGCPNQKICSSTASKASDPDIPLIDENLSDVKFKLLILSGKGGVGKSTFASQLSYWLSQDANKQIGILDLDICGPSIPVMFGCSYERLHTSLSGWSPVFARDNLAVMSVGFLLEREELAVIWRGPKKNGLIKQFLKDVDWGELDVLVIDTPPGTSDEHLSITQFLKNHKLAAVIITTPQEVSLQDVRKEINFCKKVHLPILGIVENMGAFECPKCHKTSEIFSPSSGGASQMATLLDLNFLGSLPLDPNIGRKSDNGESYFDNCSNDALYKKSFDMIAISTTIIFL